MHDVTTLKFLSLVIAMSSFGPEYYTLSKSICSVSKASIVRETNLKLKSLFRLPKTGETVYFFSQKWLLGCWATLKVRNACVQLGVLNSVDVEATIEKSYAATIKSGDVMMQAQNIYLSRWWRRISFCHKHQLIILYTRIIWAGKQALAHWFLDRLVSFFLNFKWLSNSI